MRRAHRKWRQGMGRRITPPALAILLCASFLSCSSLRQPDMVRELGWIASEDLGFDFGGGSNPSASILEEHTIQVTIVTRGGCDGIRADWDITVADSSEEGFVFILPYEYRKYWKRCGISPDRSLRVYPFTHSEVVELEAARRVLIRVVDRTGQVFDLDLDLHSP